MRSTKLWWLLPAGAMALAGAAFGQVDSSLTRAPIARTAGKLNLSGGAATFLHFERLKETSNFPETAYTKEVVQLKNLTYNIYWLDASARLNPAIDFTTRISNVSATRLWRWTMEGEPQDDTAWMSFQYAYIGVKSKSTRFELGYLAVDRANEPLEAHFTPQKTAWTPFAVATMGSIRGASVSLPLKGRAMEKNRPPFLRTEGLALGLDFTTGINTDGTGVTTTRQPNLDPAESKTYNPPSLDFILRFPLATGALRLEPLLALRSHADEDLESNPHNGHGDWRGSYGFTGSYIFSPAFSARGGIGFSRFSNVHTRNQFLGTKVVGDQAVEVYSAVKDNATTYMTLRPQWQLGPGALIGEVKYSTYRDNAAVQAYTNHYLNASVMYFVRVYPQLMIMPTLRYYRQSYDNPNEHAQVDYDKSRVCPQLLLALTF